MDLGERQFGFGRKEGGGENDRALVIRDQRLVIRTRLAAYAPSLLRLPTTDYRLPTTFSDSGIIYMFALA